MYYLLKNFGFIRGFFNFEQFQVFEQRNHVLNTNHVDFLCVQKKHLCAAPVLILFVLAR
jgi:hypothetical protein